MSSVWSVSIVEPSARAGFGASETKRPACVDSDGERIVATVPLCSGARSSSVMSMVTTARLLSSSSTDLIVPTVTPPTLTRSPLTS